MRMIQDGQQVRSVEEVEEDLAKAIAKRDQLQKQRADLQKKLDRTDYLLQEMGGRSFAYLRGTIPKLEHELKCAKLVEADRGKPVVVWKGDKSPWGGGKMIVKKVTAKRIFVNNPGYSGGDQQYYLDGTKVGNWYNPGAIDLERTFGDIEACRLRERFEETR